VLNAARDANVLDCLIIMTTDLFPDLVPRIRSERSTPPSTSDPELKAG